MCLCSPQIGCTSCIHINKNPLDLTHVHHDDFQEHVWPVYASLYNMVTSPAPIDRYRYVDSLRLLFFFGVVAVYACQHVWDPTLKKKKLLKSLGYVVSPNIELCSEPLLFDA